MKKIVILIVLSLFIINNAYAKNVEYWSDGQIRSIGNKNVEYWSDGQIRSIGNENVEYWSDGQIRFIGDD